MSAGHNMSPTARNDRCPCGSGKKYKRCCLGRAEPANTEQGRLAHVRHSAENAVVDSIVGWAGHRFGSAWSDRAIEAISTGAPPEPDEFELLLPWLLYLFPIQGAPLAQHFLAERGTELTEFQRESLACNLASHLSLWEIRRVESGVGLELFDLLTHETRFVHDVRGSREAQRWTVLLAAVTDYPEVSALAGIHPRPLPPVESIEPLTEVRRVLGVRTRAVPVARLCAPEVQLAMILAWRLAVAEQDARARAPRVVNNTDGDPLVLCADHFDVPAGDNAAVLAKLAAIEGAHAEDSDGGEVVIFSRPGNKMHASWTNTIVGRALFHGARLRVETNSVARADALRARIERALGALLQHRARELRGVEDVLANPPPEPRRAMAEPESPPELQAVLRQVLDRHYADWPDSRLPALGGRTPRQAAASKTLRPRLVAILKEFEYHEGSKLEAERFDVGKLWRELQLDPHEIAKSTVPNASHQRASRLAGTVETANKSRVTRPARIPRPKDPGHVLELKVTLREVVPPVWRRVRVRSTTTLGKFHDLLQVVMGWTNSHLHEFEAGGATYGERDPEFSERKSDRVALLGDVLRQAGDRLVYEYDFGDGWEHDVVLENVLPPDPGRGKYPCVLAGARACPPEDCGGAGGYEDLLRVLGDPSDPEHEHTVRWVNGSFDPEEFDAAALNRAFHGGWYLPKDSDAPRSDTALPRRPLPRRGVAKPRRGRSSAPTRR